MSGVPMHHDNPNTRLYEYNAMYVTKGYDHIAPLPPMCITCRRESILYQV